MESSLPRVAVVGAGGVGGVLAAALCAAGRSEVLVLARGAIYQALKSNGLTLQLAEGQRFQCTPRVISAAELWGGTDIANSGSSAAAAAAAARETGAIVHPLQDFVIVAAKRHGQAAALRDAAPLLGPSTVVIPAANGLPHWLLPPGHAPAAVVAAGDPDGTLGQLAPPDRCLGCVVYVSGDFLSAPGSDSPAAEVAPPMWISRWPSDRSKLIVGAPLGDAGGGGMHEAADRFASLFASDSDVPLRVEWSGDIRRDAFNKLAINCSLNTVCALCRLDAGAASASPRAVEAIGAIVAEVRSVAAALTPPVALTVDGATISATYVAAAGLRPSTLQDVEAGRPTETASVAGAVAALAAALCVPAPRLELADLLLSAAGDPHGDGSGRAPESRG